MNSKRDKLVYILFFVLFLNFFFFHRIGPLGGALILAGLYFLMVKMFAEGKRTFVTGLVGGSLAVAAIAILGQIVVAGPVRSLILMGAYFLTFFFTSYAFMRKYIPGSLLESVLSIPAVVGEYLRSGLEILRGVWDGHLWKSLSTENVKVSHARVYRPYLVGLMVGLPIVMWLIMLLVKADPVFNAFVRKLVSEEFLKELPGRLAMSAFFLILLVPAALMRMRKPYMSPLTFLAKTNWVREITVVIAMVGIVIGTFLVVQWPYVFVSVPKETSLASFGVATYSEYVQKGFGELLKVAGIVFGLSWVSLLIYRGAESLRERRTLLALQGVVGVEFALFLVSIFRRVTLYTMYHGLSLARLYGLVFLLWLLGMAVTMGLRYLRKTSYVRYEIIWTLTVIILSVAVNFEKILVQNPPTVNNRIDYVYLSRLSADGYEGWRESYKWAKKIFDENAYKAGLIEKDQRRDVYYAGFITRQLTFNYHRLIMQYGTDEEIKDYLRSILEAKVARVEGLTVEQYAGEDGLVTNKTHELEQLRGMLADLAGPEWFARVSVVPTYAPGYVSNDPRHNSDLVYYRTERTSLNKSTGIDRLLSWNVGENLVYQKLKSEIGVTKLLELRSLDVATQEKLDRQSEGERDFEIDISLDSPFLQ